MPFTFSHPALVLPLRRWCPRVLCWPALVIGSFLPDLWLFLPGAWLPASLAYPLLVLLELLPGLLLYGLFERALRRPLAALAPPSEAGRLWPLALAQPRWTAPHLGRVLLALLAGSLLHTAWDSFTHIYGPAVALLPVLRESLGAVAGYEVAVFKILQHGSSVAGAYFLLLAYLSWRRRTRPVEGAPRFSWGVRSVAVALVAIAALVGAGLKLGGLVIPADGPALAALVVRAVTGAIAGGFVGLLFVGQLTGAVLRDDVSAYSSSATRE